VLKVQGPAGLAQGGVSAPSAPALRSSREHGRTYWIQKEERGESAFGAVAALAKADEVSRWG